MNNKINESTEHMAFFLEYAYFNCNYRKNMPLSELNTVPNKNIMIQKTAAIFIISLASLSSVNATEILIKYKNDNHLKAATADTKQARLNTLTSLSKQSFSSQTLHSKHVYSYKSANDMSANETADLLNTLNAQNDIEYAELGGKLYPSLSPNDTSYSAQWTLFNNVGGIGIESAWDITTGSNMVIAVLDTGSLAHTDISGRILSGYDFFSAIGTDLNGNILDNDGDPGRDSNPADPGDAVGAGDCAINAPAQDSSWHGLSVSSIIAANTDNSAGMAGINWSASILPVRVLGRCGGSYPDVADAIRWAAGLVDTNLPSPPVTPAKIINLSLGGPASTCPATIQSAVNDATDAGATIVASAGNESSDSSNFALSNCDNVISVAASTIDGSRAFYTNFGSTIDITAPAGDGSAASPGTLVLGNTGLTSPASETIYRITGTSFSAPHVSGVASLIMAVRPDVTPAQLNNILKLTSRSFPSDSNCTTSSCGAGLLDAENALRYAQSNDLFGSSIDRVSFSNDQLCVLESQVSASLELQRTGSGIGDLSLTYKTISGTATSDSDFENIDARIVTWDDGDLSNKFISIPIVNDNTQESSEAFTVVISDVSDGAAIDSNNHVTITIQSDDNAPAICDNNLHASGKLSFTNSKQNISETIGSVNISVARNGGASGIASVEYRTISGGATESNDYTPANGTLTWGDGDSSNKTISININNDDDKEANENFSVELFDNSSGTILEGNTVSVVVIESDEKAGGGAQLWLLLLTSLALGFKRRNKT